MDAVFMQEGLGDGEAAVEGAEDGTKTLVKEAVAWSVGMFECPCNGLVSYLCKRDWGRRGFYTIHTTRLFPFTIRRHSRGL